MGIFDRIWGSGRTPEPQPAWGAGTGSQDDQAVARYRYMLRTASPEAIEQTHAEAFAKLTPEQRRRVLNELSAELPEAERDTVLRAGETPTALARAATRAEIRQPGTLERTFGRVGGGPGLGGMMAGTFLSTMAGAVIGTAIAQHFLGAAGSDAAGAVHDTNADMGGGFADAGGDAGGGFDDGGGGFDI